MKGCGYEHFGLGKGDNQHWAGHMQNRTHIDNVLLEYTVWAFLAARDLRAFELVGYT